MQSAQLGTIEVIMMTLLKLSEEKQRTHVHINDTGHRQEKNEVNQPNINSLIYLLDLLRGQSVNLNLKCEKCTQSTS